MSIKTTHNVTREFALAAITLRLHSLTDEDLANVLETVIHNGFYNFTIDNESYPRLDDLNALPESNNAC